ncbi:acyltransferase ChoActase/COT/CPT [Zychaea mexicana]|uniref:acyltransferase ChoActase/COT/CPT n=1 Tax=Zychaea mexicana TaxID=64656 RepID=UPI0022FEFF97|nr:acyltransferase ChoActase/COT/CPT [Zychaea mexicana]KAI9498725.1 acyltransferase ChoActase/COT/CPT [Zychaea mexicana]
MTRTYSLQHTLPRLPVPSLKESCALYLQSLKPLLTPEQLAQSEKHVSDFLASELSRSLQQRLIDIDLASPNNWLEDNFWLRKAYLEWRDPLMVNSNWYMLGRDDAKHPEELLANNGVRPFGQFTHFQVHRAAHMIYRGVEYKELLEAEAIPVDMIKGQAQCMWQHSRIFTITRVPFYHCDTLIQQDISTCRHIVVLARDQVYRVPIYKQQGQSWQRLTAEEIEQHLLAIVSHSLQLQQPQSPIGVMTAWDRDNWAVARNHLLALDPQNKATADIIETSLFAIALDDHSFGADTASWTRTAFCGHQGLGNGHNRWYDKSLTFVFESNGKCYLTGEHSPCDALLVSYLWDHMLDVHCTAPFDASIIKPAFNNIRVQHLTWRTDAFIDQCLRDAQASADATAAFSDSCTCYFDDYGTDWVKKVGKVPPDAFYQMVLQLAYYRLHKKVVPTYETGSTRKYLRGRTDTIRTCSVESKAFVEGWCNDAVDIKAKYELLVKATSAHRKYTQIASEGKACDRHLMVLRLLNADHQIRSTTTGKLETAPMHAMFKDPIFQESMTWTLSTSGLQAGIRLMGTGFGAATPTGYGVNYMAAPMLVKFGIECKRVPETVTAQEFSDTLRKVLLDMKDVCEQVGGQAEQQQAKI